MNLIENLKQEFQTFLKEKFSLTANQIEPIDFDLNVDDEKKEFGDISSNAALILGKLLKKNPKEIANIISSEFKNTYINKIEVAGPGFINFFLKLEAYIELLKELNINKEKFFQLNEAQTKQRHYSIEFVSANPTGPLHIGHGRGGIIGDVLGNILKFLGYKVTKEFYINDAGNQIKLLGLSLKARCLQELGMEASIPEEGYQGAYLIDIAKKAIQEFGKDVVHKDDDFFANYAKEYLLNQIKITLKDYGINFDVWFSEKSLYENSQVQKAINKLVEKGFTYEKDGALWFKSTEFGDDKDRVIRKSTNEFTYVASDIAYMINKIERGANFLVMVLGQDHHSYVVRLKGIQKALGLEQYPLEVILYQLVKMKQSEQLIKMSKRAGNIVMLRDIVETVGKDVARFFYLNRKADAQLEFNIDLALTKTEDNPVYYIQYAYVRTKSILSKANELPEFKNINVQDISNINHEEYALIRKIISFRDLLISISANFQTHLLAYYIIELATKFHRYYYNHKIIDLDNIEKSRSRLLLTKNLKDTFEICLNLLGISTPEKM